VKSFLQACLKLTRRYGSQKQEERKERSQNTNRIWLRMNFITLYVSYSATCLIKYSMHKNPVDSSLDKWLSLDTYKQIQISITDISLKTIKCLIFIY